MTVGFLRLFFILMSVVTGFFIGPLFSGSQLASSFGAFSGFLGAALVILMEMTMRRFSVRNLSAAVFGLMFGLFMAWLLTSVLKLTPMSPELYSTLQITFILVFCYLGMIIAMKGKDEFNVIVPYIKFSRQDETDEIILIDTSTIIDGRIADILKTKFIEGRILVPRFVLRELQQVADSQDSLKRNRGRRGLDILNKMQKDENVIVRIHDEDFPEIKDVDAKLVKLGKVLGAKVLTNDYNLNKIAELQGVTVLNINELTNALRPVVLPGEAMDVRISKEGKEHNQGVAYLDDGTMIVVENARQMIGQTVKVVVTSVLQTSAGRMIFARLENAKQRPHR
ncbi:MAG: TRAM domain-containing protein [Candidatus Omnitrophota bacterium]